MLSRREQPVSMALPACIVPVEVVELLSSASGSLLRSVVFFIFPRTSPTRPLPKCQLEVRKWAVMDLQEATMYATVKQIAKHMVDPQQHNMNSVDL